MGASEYKSGKLSYHEASATVLVGARAASDIGALWLAAERERLGEAFLSGIRERAAERDDAKMMSWQSVSEIAAERKRQGTSDATIAQIVLERLGGVADALAAAPFARHGIPDPIAELRATATTGARDPS